MSTSIPKNILSTICYSDIFDYPLTLDEISRFFIGNKKIDEKKLAYQLEGGRLIKMVVLKNGFYCFKNRTKIINKRIRREEESIKKLQLAQKIILKLCLVPTVQLIGISGALAMKNSEKNDDIDLFIIAKKNTLWITRFFLLLLLEIFGRRRKRNEIDPSDKFCMNMLIDESLLLLPKERQNLYSAHEIVQLMPVFQRENMHEKFIKVNKWVNKFLPNFKFKSMQQKTQSKNSSFLEVVLRFISPLADLVLLSSALNNISKHIQLFYIKRHKTTETVSDHILAFHPFDYKAKILSAYQKRLEKYNIEF